MWIQVSGNATLQDLTGFDGIIAETMRRKRLQHVADTMCLMFCGWRLIASKPSLLKLGSGTLEIDAITGQCVFQGKTTGQLTIAEEMHAWLLHDLATNRIPIATWRTAWRRALKDAKLPIRFHDLRHCCITKLAESQASEQTIMAIAGHLSRAMLEHFSHIRMAAKRTALESIVKPSENIVFREGVNQNVHQLSIASFGLSPNSMN